MWTSRLFRPQSALHAHNLVRIAGTFRLWSEDNAGSEQVGPPQELLLEDDTAA